MCAVDDESHFAPFPDGVQIYPAVDEGLGQISPPGLQGVGPDGDGTLDLVSLQRLHQLGNVENLKQKCKKVKYEEKKIVHRKVS